MTMDAEDHGERVARAIGLMIDERDWDVSVVIELEPPPFGDYDATGTPSVHISVGEIVQTKMGTRCHSVERGYQIFGPCEYNASDVIAYGGSIYHGVLPFVRRARLKVYRHGIEQFQHGYNRDGCSPLRFVD